MGFLPKTGLKPVVRFWSRLKRFGGLIRDKPRRKPCSTKRPHFDANARPIGANCRQTDIELVGDGMVGRAACHQLENLPFPAEELRPQHVIKEI